MKQSAASEALPMSPAQQLGSFFAKYDPAVANLARAARAKVRKRLPTSVEMVYDNYNALVVGFGPNERASEAIVSLALYPTKVGLVFIQGARLPDPHRILRGSGNQVRSIPLQRAAEIDTAVVQALFDAAVRYSKTPFPETGHGYTVIKSIAAKQRARRPAQKRAAQKKA